MNRVFLSGVLADDPQQGRDRNGEPVLLLKVAFPAPGTRDTPSDVEVALESVEVPEKVAERHRDELSVGEAIFFAGQLSGGDGLIVTEIYPGLPPGSASRP
jgi:hypothetical protein